MTLKQNGIEKVEVYTYRVPTDSPESDGTIEWDSTSIVLVKIYAENQVGIGFTYGHESALFLIKDLFFPILKNSDPFDIPFLWKRMCDQVRNVGLPGIAAHAISAVDIALWDLKAKLLELPLCKLFGNCKTSMEVYGSGGFTSYSHKQLARQFEHWQKQGIKKFKMKVGRDPQEDPDRVKYARKVIGNAAKLFVDANGAYQIKEAATLATKFGEYSVTWFEEPVSSDHLKGLHFLRKETPVQMNITAGEYGYDLTYFQRMLENQAVDILQIDATRACGYTGFIQACHLSRAYHIPISSHTAPSLHLHVCLGQWDVLHMEYFYDHVRIEEIFFEGFPRLEGGCLYPHFDRLGHGLSLKEEDVKKYLTNSC